jgi:hypothetical protein
MKPPFYGKGSLLFAWCALVVWDMSWLAYESTRHKWAFVALFAVLAVWAVYGIAANTYEIGKKSAQRKIHD